MTYQVLARKWRPKNFEQMVGQQAVVRTLSNALTQNRLHHAYLFTGTRGVGKTTIARIIAKCLNCEQGISATPCDTCQTCQSINQGQFVDLIEVDAASRTKVEDTRELLDNVQYAPTEGLYKIYLIDEVHMLSGHSFNALLKTLEEPPEHVKFLLATTDPQKLPITVLSRCLQFHLKGIAPEVIAEHLQDILGKENIAYEAEAIKQIAHAANGSMRDALSILDQAIAYGNNKVETETTRNMLGSTATIDLLPLLEALAKQDGKAMLQNVAELAAQGCDFNQVTVDLLNLLHKINFLQVMSDLYQDDVEILQLQHFAKQFSPEDIQLFYQIGVNSHRDLPYAPSPRSGFEMMLLRMLHFMPRMSQQQPEPVQQQNKPAQIQKVEAALAAKSAPKSSQATESWAEIVPKLEVKGMAKALAQHCVLDQLEETKIQLHIESSHRSLANAKQTEQLEKALQTYFGQPLKLTIQVENDIKATPAKLKQQAQSEQLAQAKNNLISDPHVQSILDDFGGSLDENSIQPT